MSGESRFGVWFTRLWVSVYTLGLAAEDAQRRRMEIESDLHEQAVAVGTAGILGRSLRGMPADVYWRVRTRFRRSGKTEEHPESFGEAMGPLTATRRWGRLLRRELVGLAIAGVGLLLILPLASEANPEYEAAQTFLDDMSAAALSIRDGASTTGDFSAAQDGFSAASAPVADGTVGTILTGDHAGRCFVVHWQGASAPRAGVLNPALGCDASPTLVAGLASTSFLEVFPGTLPLDASQLVSRVDEARHGSVEPFPVERTAAWFIPVTVILVGIIAWELAGITIKLLVHRSARRYRWTPHLRSS